MSQNLVEKFLDVRADRTLVGQAQARDARKGVADRRGVRLHVNGDRLRWVAPVGVVTEADLSALRDNKAEVLAILREAETDRIEERAAILQFDAYLTRREAERRARNEQHPANGGNAA